MPMLNCLCTHCLADITFEPDQAGKDVTCPKCGMLTILSFQSARAQEAARQAQINKPESPIGHLIGIGFKAAGALLVVVVAGVALYTLGGSGGALVSLLAGAFLLLILVVLWIAFPIFVYFGFRRLEGIIAQIEKNTRK